VDNAGVRIRRFGRIHHRDDELPWRAFFLRRAINAKRGISGSERGAVVELGVTHLERVGLAVVADFPRFGKSGFER
jgi:hypothetical protein